jgi:hypothetical protein
MQKLFYQIAKWDIMDYSTDIENDAGVNNGLCFGC